MLSSQRFIVASCALIAGIGFGFLLAQIISIPVPTTTTKTFTPPSKQAVVSEINLKEALLPNLTVRFGSTTTSFTAQQIHYVYPNITHRDFDGVPTAGGGYQYKDNLLWHIGSSTMVNAEAVTDEGFKVLYENLRARLLLPRDIRIEALLPLLETFEDGPNSAPLPADGVVTEDGPGEEDLEPTMCPMDAKQCSDGSFVSRVAPGCAFAPCPDEEVLEQVGTCTPEQREAEACIELYAPVCASVQVQCVTTPCEPIPTTYSNSCFACADDSVVSYTEGACLGDAVAY